MKKHLLILSGGHGSRFKHDLPKQYHTGSNGITILERSIREFFNIDFDSVTVVCHKEFQDIIEEILLGFSDTKILFAKQGLSRQASINNGVREIITEFGNDGQLFIQESVRPFISKKVVQDLVNAPEEWKNVSPALNPIVLFGKQENGEVVKLIPKSDILELQLPKRYDLSLFEKFVLSDTREDLEIILDESAYFIDNGINIRTIEGVQKNIKITYFEDKDLL